jgi:hypothetical protein
VLTTYGHFFKYNLCPVSLPTRGWCALHIVCCELACVHNLETAELSLNCAWDRLNLKTYRVWLMITAPVLVHYCGYSGWNHNKKAFTDLVLALSLLKSAQFVSRHQGKADSPCLTKIPYSRILAGSMGQIQMIITVEPNIILLDFNLCSKSIISSKSYSIATAAASASPLLLPHLVNSSRSYFNRKQA